MSKFSLEFWNGSEAGDRVLVGFGNVSTPWWYDAKLQGAESNIYDETIPVGDVVRRLFHWEPVSAPVYAAVPCTFDEATTIGPSGEPLRFVVAPDRQAIVSSDTSEILGIFKSGYQAHSYQTWLLGNVSNLLGGEVGIGSAGFANRERSQAFVQVRTPETVTTPQGVEFLPHLLAYTSLDGTLATTYKRCSTIVVCDNTFSAAIGQGAGSVVKVKHTRYSHLRLTDAQQALGLITETAEDFSATIAALCEQEVTKAQFGKVLDVLIPRPSDEGRAQTLADTKRDGILSLYAHDTRVAPWAGTAFGVLQAFDTYDRYYSTVRGVSRPERVLSGTIDGTYDKGADAVLKALALV